MKNYMDYKKKRNAVQLLISKKKTLVFHLGLFYHMLGSVSACGIPTVQVIIGLGAHAYLKHGENMNYLPTILFLRMFSLLLSFEKNWANQNTNNKLPVP